MTVLVKCLSLLVTISVLAASPVVWKGNSPSGDTVIAISSSDPNIERYLTMNFDNPGRSNDPSAVGQNPSKQIPKTFSTAIAGTNVSTGRNFGSFNPFFLPYFNFPLIFESLGLGQFGPSQARGFGGYEPNYTSQGGGGVQTVTDGNDNGQQYGKVNTVTF